MLSVIYSVFVSGQDNHSRNFTFVSFNFDNSYMTYVLSSLDEENKDVRLWTFCTS